MKLVGLITSNKDPNHWSRACIPETNFPRNSVEKNSLLRGRNPEQDHTYVYFTNVCVCDGVMM